MQHQVIHAISETLPIIPTVVKSPCGQFFFVHKSPEQLTHDPARITCEACLKILAHPTLHPQRKR
jgi:hypothetical protein